MLKRIARKILKKEIEELKNNYDNARKDYVDLVNKYEAQADERIKDLQDVIDKQKAQNEAMQKLADENEILKKYYDLDSEPTDEQKTKIRIDLRIHDLEMQLIEERTRLRSFPVVLSNTYNPYSQIYYRPFGGTW